ncbi:hypothetical protein H7F51_14640 [Novosphingobium flavum]|uniref:Uncharacterized protein n=1 Tax=Novosphingobium flavum TaxID=1778672 RepID=A0A7X1FTL7_9SPHN|nr:hypothetical protein [Novosphingobium flavum]MBC2666755.1 hypothetical protein [Novosphingobium flavum]
MTQPDAAAPRASAIPAGGPVPGSPDVPPRKVSPALLAGIALLPGIFIWFLLRKGHSPAARAAGFGWAGLLLIVAANLPAGMHPAKTRVVAGPAAPTSGPSPAPLAQPTSGQMAAILAGRAAREKAVRSYIEALDAALEESRETGMIYHEDQPETTWQVSVQAIGTDGDLYTEGNRFAEDAAVQAHREAWRRETAALQAKAFPRLRVIHAKALSGKLWENDITVEATGPGNATLRFTGYLFAANRNIKAVMEKVHVEALATRFRRAEFRTYPGDGITSYQLEPLPDTALASFSFGRWTAAERAGAE